MLNKKKGEKKSCMKYKHSGLASTSQTRDLIYYPYHQRKQLLLFSIVSHVIAIKLQFRLLFCNYVSVFLIIFIRFWPDYVRERVRSTYTYFGVGIASTAASAFAMSRNPALMARLMPKSWVVSIQFVGHPTGLAPFV